MEEQSFQSQTDTCNLLKAGDLVLDLDKKRVTRADLELRLKRKEMQILEYLIRNKNQIISRVDLIGHIWKEHIKSNTLDAHICSLHKKVDGKFSRRLIYTATGRGFILMDPIDTGDGSKTAAVTEMFG